MNVCCLEVLQSEAFCTAAKPSKTDFGTMKWAAPIVNILKMWMQLCNWTVGRNWRSMMYILGIQMLKVILVRYQADVRNKSWTVEDRGLLWTKCFCPHKIFILRSLT